MKDRTLLAISRILCCFALLLGISLRPVTAQNSNFTDANWSSMGDYPGVDGGVYAAVVDGSGNLYIGGGFHIVGDVFANGIAKWDGTNWSALGSGLGSVTALAVSGNNVYAADYATSTIAKWDGKNWSVLGSVTNENSTVSYGAVGALVVSGTNLYAGGRFTTADGVAATNIAKWNGSSWSSVGSLAAEGLGNIFARVSALAVLNGEVYVGGSFTMAGGVAATNIAKWNGNSWSALSSGVNGSVSALAVLGNDLYAGGYFSRAGGSAANRIAKWSGSDWTAFDSGIGISEGSVSVLATSGNDLYAGGYLAAGVNVTNSVAKWNGTTWVTLGSKMSGYVHALTVSGNNVYVGGQFGIPGDGAANNLAKWNGSNWSALASGMNDRVEALAAAGSNVYVGGDFTTVGGIAANQIAKWNGSSWTALGSGVGGPPGYSYTVFALAASGNDLYAGGWFTTAGGAPANYIAKWNGSNWSALGSGLSGGGSYGTYVFALAVSASDLYVGGHFTNAGGIAANHIAKWDGSNWSALGSGMSGGLPPMPLDSLRVTALAVSGDNVYAGGVFTNAGGIAANHIAKWDGTNWSTLGSGMDGPVGPLAVSGNDLYAGGVFTTAGGVAATNIAKWDGSNWSPLGSGIGDADPNNWSYVSELVVSGTDLYAAGQFTTAGGSVANYIAKWNGSSWTALGSGMGGFGVDTSVSALAVSGSDLYAGGQFTTAGGKVSAFMARAYLLDLPALSVLRSGTDVTVSWLSADTSGFILEQASSLKDSGSWVTNSANITDDGTNKSMTLPATNTSQVFRLRRP